MRQRDEKTEEETYLFSQGRCKSLISSLGHFCVRRQRERALQQYVSFSPFPCSSLERCWAEAGEELTLTSLRTAGEIPLYIPSIKAQLQRSKWDSKVKQSLLCPSTPLSPHSLAQCVSATRFLCSECLLGLWSKSLCTSISSHHVTILTGAQLKSVAYGDKSWDDIHVSDINVDL